MKSYLHRYLSVVNQDLAGQEVGADGRFVASTEFLVDLYESKKVRCQNEGSSWLGSGSYRTYWFIKLVLPTPLSPRIIT